MLQSNSVSPFSGSPPPMRGKVRLLYHRGELFRITPAYAGKRQVGLELYFPRWDHPRLCGEKGSCLQRQSFPEGSPPPMRGKVPHATPGVPPSRITPAYAGKSFFAKAFKVSMVGSPPPMRGKAMKLMLWQKAFRITPAYAGKRTEGSFSYETSRDHPRLCGEKPERVSINDIKAGSPPPMRGKV